MAEAKVSSKTPATTAKKGKGEKERDVITRIKDLLPQWEIQKVEAFCAEHGHDLEKIHAALDSSYERTGHQPDDWQVMTKKEQKPKRGGFRADGGSREPRESSKGPREDRPRGERGGRGRGGAESSRGGGRGRGGGDRRGGRGGAAAAGANRSKENSSNPAVMDLSSISVDNAPSTTETWGADSSAQDAKPESTTAEWGASSSPVASTPLAVASVAPVPASSRVVEAKKMSWAQKASAGAAKKAQLTELQSAEAFPPQQSQQILGPAVVHVQPTIPAGPSYRAALQGNSRWGPKKPDAVVEQTDTSMVPLEQQTSAMTIDAYQPSDTYASGQVNDNSNSNSSPQDNNDVTTTSDVLNSISDVQQDQVTSFPQAEAFQPESSFQQPQQTDNSFQIYQASQNQQPSVSEQQTSQSTVYSSSPSGFDDIRSPQNFSQDNNSGKTVIDLLAATNNVILPHVEPAASFGIEFGTFGQTPSTVYSSSAQPEPVQQQQAEVQPVAVQQQQPLTEQNTPTETQQQQQLPQSFVSTLREDSLPAKQASVDNSGSQFSAQNQFYQGQSQPVPPPSQPQSQTQSQPNSYRGPSGSYDPHYAGGYPFPGYENSSPYYDFAARDNQQSYQPNYDYSSQFRGGATGGGGSRRPAASSNPTYYPSPTTRGPSDGTSGNASPPTSEPVSPKSASFSKPASFATNKQSFSSNTAKISPQIPTYTGKPAGVPPNAGGYNKPPAVAAQPSQKSFKPPSQPQGAQSQHHPDPQHYMYPPAGVYGAYPYPYPYQAPGQMPPGFMHPQMPYAPYDPRYSYPYPSPVQSFEGDYEQYPKSGAHYSEGGTTPRGATEWNGQNADGQGQQKPNNASAPGANAPSSANAIPSTMPKNTVAPGANKKRFEYEDPHYNSGYGFAGAPASSPMAMHAAAAPYQPANYGQPILHAMGGQAPYGGGQYEAHPRGYTGGSWQ